MCKIHILFICEDVSYIKCKIRGYTISYYVFIYVEIILLDRLVITSNKIIFVTLLLSLVNLLSSNINISLSPKRLKLLGSEPAYFFSFPNKYISHGIKVSWKVKSEKWKGSAVWQSNSKSSYKKFSELPSSNMTESLNFPPPFL